MRAFMSALMLALAFPAAAHAQTPIQIIKDAGMIGTWAIRCGEKPSANNPYEYVALAGGGLRWSTEVGPDYKPNEYVVLDAKRVSQEEIWIRARLNGTSVRHLIRLFRDDHMRALLNQAEDGTDVLVKDGAVLSTKRETPWATKCR